MSRPLSEAAIQGQRGPMHARKFFGTDGIRGNANRAPMTCRDRCCSVGDGRGHAFLAAAATATGW